MLLPTFKKPSCCPSPSSVRDASGFTLVFEAMRNSGKPAVGHNCMFDVLYTLAAFAEPSLPPSWPGFKRLTAEVGVRRGGGSGLAWKKRGYSSSTPECTSEGTMW